MLNYMRNKLVGIWKKGPDALLAHGVLDDDIYSLQIDVSIDTSKMEITAIEGKWHRWTTPECPRALNFLEEAVGFKIDAADFSQKVHKIVGRKACRHYANLLLECCHCAKEAVGLIRAEAAKEKGSGQAPEKTGGGKPAGDPAASTISSESAEKSLTPGGEITDRGTHEKISGGPVIDLHTHTSQASPCSSAPVDDLIREAKRIGLDGICLTDHNHVWDSAEIEALRAKHDFLVLKGNEITTDQGDMVVFGLEKDIQGIITLEDLKKEVDQAGGFIIVAHPFRGFLTFGVGQLGLTPEKAMERPLFQSVDAVEVLNSKVTVKENAFAAQVAAGLNLPQTGGSDAHEVEEVGIYATRFAAAIRNETDLINALKTGKYVPVAFRRKNQENR